MRPYNRIRRAIMLLLICMLADHWLRRSDLLNSALFKTVPNVSHCIHWMICGKNILSPATACGCIFGSDAACSELGIHVRRQFPHMTPFIAASSTEPFAWSRGSRTCATKHQSVHGYSARQQTQRSCRRFRQRVGDDTFGSITSASSDGRGLRNLIRSNQASRMSAFALRASREIDSSWATFSAPYSTSGAGSNGSRHAGIDKEFTRV